MQAKIRKTLWAIAATVVAAGASHEAVTAPKMAKDTSNSKSNPSQTVDELTQYGGTAVGGVRG